MQKKRLRLNTLLGQFKQNRENTLDKNNKSDSHDKLQLLFPERKSIITELVMKFQHLISSKPPTTVKIQICSICSILYQSNLLYPS